MTYNIRGGLGLDRRRDIGRIAGVVVAERPDLVCFQEVHRRLPWSGWADQPSLLQRMTGMRFVFQPNVRFGLGGFGVGIGSRYPLRRVRRHRLPGGRERRGVLQVRVETPDGPVTVFCTHWGLTREERLRQAQATLTYLRLVETPVVFCGDLNDRPDADYVVVMRERAGLRDCGHVSNLPTYPADSPTARIDVVFSSPVLSLERLSVIDTAASDHRPVVADLRWVG